MVLACIFKDEIVKTEIETASVILLGIPVMLMGESKQYTVFPYSLKSLVWDYSRRAVFTQPPTDLKETEQNLITDHTDSFLKRDLNNKHLNIYVANLWALFNIVVSLNIELLPTQLNGIYLT